MIRKLLAETFELSETDPKVEKALETLHKCLYIDTKRSAAAVRNKQIYELRAGGLSVKDICARYSISRQTCHLAIRTELIRRRYASE